MFVLVRQEHLTQPQEFLVQVDHIVPGSVPLSVEGPLVLLVKEADGDEEVRRTVYCLM